MINIGIIGCGYWGPNIMRNFQAIKGCQVKMVADLIPENLTKIKKLYPQIITTQNYKDILRNPQIDAVAVITQAATHYSLIKESLLSGKHVFAEKPITLKSSEGEKLISLAKKRRKILMVGHVFEYNSLVRKIKEIIKKGELGKIYFIFSSRLSPGPIRSDVSVVWDFAFHDISIITYLLDKNPLRVSAKGHNSLKKSLEDFGFIDLEFPNHISSRISVAWLYPTKERGMIIVGSKKMLVYNDIDREKPLVLYNKGINWSAFKKSKKISFYDKGVSYPKVKQKEPLRVECQHFIDCLRKKKTPLTDGKRGVKIVKILEKIQKSLDSNGKLINV
ncbi:MAG TPA: Gfo/Idh/MocA family oxidoreductase [Candidatus Parcubacteria bacterium]|nr:Gfo/Idh/MocA family oxidoreductase [Candidatus Parcubacteria bacterium]